MLRLAFLCALLLPATPAFAELVSCKTSIRGETYDFRYDPDNAALKDSRSLREKVLGERGDVTCPALVTLRALTPELDDAGRAPFCLQWDRKAKTYLGYDEGARDAYGMCRKPSKSFCQRLVGTTQAVQGLGTGAEGLAADAAGAVVGDQLGTKIVRDQSSRLRDKLLQAGIGVLAASSPPALAATAVIVGGTVYVCSDRGAEGAAMQAAPEPDLKSGAEIAEGAELLGAKLPKTHLPEGVEGAPNAPVEVAPLGQPDAPDAPDAPDTPAAQ
ncbi:hypothetical protein [Thioclava indica]|uniref:Uncharacterized protein n=1 Tax=Thioclava indica TaxID=1353528 RepID=A0A074KFW5_9RHOB|nr:hypothetical protein [Thioclava indica]KEO60457.1 hypothetical protein DT23_02930 [Thioclava indica]